MKSIRFSKLIICYLLISGSIWAQDAVDTNIFRIAELPDTIDQAKADAYLNGIEAELDKLAGQFRQLSSWKLINPLKKSSDNGRLRRIDGLIYAHGLTDTKSSKFLDRFGPKSLYIRVKIESKRSFAYISGSGVGSVVHGWSVAGGCLIAQITSAKPRVTKLEKQLIQIIELGASRKTCE